MWSFFTLALYCMIGWSNSQRCPMYYQRFSAQHSYCLAPNPTCNIVKSGVGQQEKEEILRLHNEFRSKVAMGNEHRSIGGSLPEVADMMQLEWDDELSAVAQKWTDNCEYKHDCNECRAVENFPVGQNLAFQESTCMGRICREDQKVIPNWSWAITAFYDEVKDYHKDWLWSFVEHKGPKTGHLTQLIWAKTWRIGCGYTVYKEGRTYTRYYACNYGPTGNSVKKPVYQAGPPCSACPTNSHCVTWSSGPGTYPGLCKMSNPNTAPIYIHNNVLFDCNSNPANTDCQSRITGANKWDIITSVGGNYHSVILRGGESTTLAFDKPIIPHGQGFCVVLKFRKGPLDASNRDQSSFKAHFGMEYGSSSPMSISSGSTSFKDYRTTLNEYKD
ncbi:CRISP/Allergen/PR-1 like protein [Argiope bruennichi]|uniref:CRISP/Allergen/PR-1 like protein n=1 Tax=Argiope bruennichi TaxID=94029 RepID=A0A8T0E6H5_ARGBR|nr:CRISP/Allergen/PR-1 like protein [Argiope bruennichi]